MSPKKQSLVPCLYCGGSYIRKSPKQRYCKKLCANNASRSMKRTAKLIASLSTMIKKLADDSIMTPDERIFQANRDHLKSILRTSQFACLKVDVSVEEPPIGAELEVIDEPF